MARVVPGHLRATAASKNERAKSRFRIFPLSERGLAIKQNTVADLSIGFPEVSQATGALKSENPTRSRFGLFEFHVRRGLPNEDQRCHLTVYRWKT